MKDRTTHYVMCAGDSEFGRLCRGGRVIIERYEDDSATVIYQGPEQEVDLFHLSPSEAMGVLLLRDLIFGAGHPTALPGWVEST